MKIVCTACGNVAHLPEKVGYRDTCPFCDAWFHSCVHCALWINSQCTEPSAEKVRDPEGQNYCDWYRGIEANSADEREKTGERETAEEMWKKLTEKKQ